jgi:hypothetical protein
LRRGATLASEGLPQTPNRLLRYSSVQEQPAAWGSTGSSWACLWLSGGTTPYAKVQLRFTELAALPQTYNRRQWLVDNRIPMGTCSLTDCQMRGVSWTSFCSTEETIGMTNTLFERVNATWGDSEDSARFHGRNNLFRNSQLTYYPNAYAAEWEWKENLFDGTTIYQYTSLTNTSHNGYLNSTRLTPTNANDVVLASFTYTNGTLGRYYQVSTNLIDAGSRTAAAAGLFHYTTQAGQTKDTNTVDIGLHYVATDASGQPLDTDGDGLPDYFEDRDGDGTYDTGTNETDWQTSENGTTGTAGLQVFTPLE